MQTMQDAPMPAVEIIGMKHERTYNDLDNTYDIKGPLQFRAGEILMIRLKSYLFLVSELLSLEKGGGESPGSENPGAFESRGALILKVGGSPVGGREIFFSFFFFFFYYS